MKKYIVKENLRTYRDWSGPVAVQKKFHWKDCSDEDYDFGPTRMRFYYARNRKGGIGNTGWLHRFLISKCGQRWDTVHSELFTSITDKISTSALKRLLYWWVERAIYVNKEGVVCYYDRDYPIWDGFYVLDGILRYQFRKHKRHRTPESTLLIVDDLHEYEFLYGYWYYRTYEMYTSCWNDSTGKLIKNEYKHQVSQLQLSKKETDWLLGLRHKPRRITKPGRYLTYANTKKTLMPSSGTSFGTATTLAKGGSGDYN